MFYVVVSSRQIDFEQITAIKAHDSKINDLIVNTSANLVVSCS